MSISTITRFTASARVRLCPTAARRSTATSISLPVIGTGDSVSSAIVHEMGHMIRHRFVSDRQTANVHGDEERFRTSH